ncbi:MAG: MotE family protein [Planctomycetota bacterium]|jgi:hypothetical protein
MIRGLRKAYQLVALLAVLHLLGVGGVVGYLAATGRLTPEQVRQMAAVLREAPPQAAAAQAETVEEEPAPPAKSTDSIEQDQVEEELTRYQMQRRRAELDQQAATIGAARLEVIRQREALQREYEELEAQLKRRVKQEESESFKKDLELFSSMKPKVAVDYMLRKPPEEAARMLLLMDTRKAKRIVEAAKTPGQKKDMAKILQMLREVAPAGSEALLDQKGT